MNKTQPSLDFNLDEINSNFVFTAKTIGLIDYYNSNFIKKINYDFKDLPILNFIDKSKFYLIQNEKYFRAVNSENGFVYQNTLNSNIQKIKEIIKNIRNKDPHYYDHSYDKKIKIDSSAILKILKNNIMKNFIKHKMYHHITQNYREFDTLLLFKTFHKAPDEDLLFMIEKLKNIGLYKGTILSSKLQELLTLFIIHVICKRKHLAEIALSNLPDITYYGNDLKHLQYIFESNNCLHLAEYFKDNNNIIYLKLIEKHTNNQIQNF